MRIPFLNLWDDNNITLSYDLGNGVLKTQGGDARYEEAPRSVVFAKQPTTADIQEAARQDAIQQNKLENVKKEVAAREALANLTVPQKPSVPAQAVAQRTDFSLDEDALQRKFEEAERALEEEKALDANSGSEGYEKKEDGVFNRLASFGNSVKDYLFGPKTDKEELDEMTDEILKQDEINRRGALGYYGDKAASALMGENYKNEWDEIKEGLRKQGALGYIPQKGAELLNTMAMSPYARFTDPTTMFGGQQTMVENLDNYFANRGLGAVRNDLLARQKLDTEMNKTKFGQELALLNLPPETQAAILSNRLAGKAAAGANAYNPKTLQQAALVWPGTDEEFLQRYGVPRKEALVKADAPRQMPYNQQAELDEAQRRVVANPDAYAGDTPEAKLYNAWREVQKEGKNQPYQRRTVEEDIEAAGGKELIKQFTGKDGELASIRKMADKAATTLQSVNTALDVITEYPNFVGGGSVGETVENIMRNASFRSDKEKREAAASLSTALKDVFLGQMAEVIEQINKGQISDPERELFKSLVANLGDSPEELTAKLRAYSLLLTYAKMKQDFVNENLDLPLLEQYKALQKYKADTFNWLNKEARVALTGDSSYREEE